MELVEQGLKNREIARELGIRPGTVKIHLKHIFEKTGVRGRYGLALTGLRQKGVLNVDRHVDRESEQPAERRLERKLDGQLDRQLESLLAR